MTLRQFIFDNIQPIEDGKTVTLTCPNCDTRGKFTATVKDDLILYNCYRNSCNTSGAFSLHLSADAKIKASGEKLEAYRTREGRDDTNYVAPFVAPGYWVDGIGDDRCLKYLESNHMLQAFKDGLFRPMYDPAEQRFIFPIKDATGKVEGAIGRTLIGAIPKVHNYNKTFEKPFICGGKNEVLLVEDCASAVAATRGGRCAGMALLGTKIRKGFIKYLSPYSVVWIALDRDAYASTIILRTHLTAYLKDVRIIKLETDIKNMPDKDYEELWLNQ